MSIEEVKQEECNLLLDIHVTLNKFRDKTGVEVDGISLIPRMDGIKGVVTESRYLIKLCNPF